MDSEGGDLRLQHNPDKLEKWAGERQIEFNSDKRQAPHFVKLNEERSYTMC